MNVPKHLGRDGELSVTGADPDGRPIPSYRVSRDILAQVSAAFDSYGHRAWSRGDGHGSSLSMDSNRHWLPQGGCAYIDLGHYEACHAETISPRHFAAQSIANLRIAEAARRRAEITAEPGTVYRLGATNADIYDPESSWGTHVNISVSQRLWESLFLDPRRPGVLGSVLSALAAAIPFFGAGFLLPFRDGVLYSLSARAHHLTRSITLSTTEAYKRGILNSRREALAKDVERLHLIGFDQAVLSEALLAAFLQCLMAAAERDWCGPILRDPVRALGVWSWSIDLPTGALPQTAERVDGGVSSLPQFLREITLGLISLREAGDLDGDVSPEVDDLLALIVELTHHAERGSLESCAKHLTWAAKLLVLKSMCTDGGAAFGDETTRIADHDFLDTDPARGTIWDLWSRGLVDPLVSEDQVEATLVDGPEETRAWARGRLIQRFRSAIADVDWDEVELRLDESRWGPRFRVDLSRIDHLGRARFESVLESSRTVRDLARALRRLPDAGDNVDPIESMASRLVTDPPLPRANGDAGRRGGER